MGNRRLTGYARPDKLHDDDVTSKTLGFPFAFFNIFLIFIWSVFFVVVVFQPAERFTFVRAEHGNTNCCSRRHFRVVETKTM